MDLDLVVKEIGKALDVQYDRIITNLSHDQLYPPPSYNAVSILPPRLRFAVLNYALNLIIKQYTLAVRYNHHQGPEIHNPPHCTGAFERTQGLPCWHLIHDALRFNSQWTLTAQHISHHWYYQRPLHSELPPQPVLEALGEPQEPPSNQLLQPNNVRTVGRPRENRITTSTRRDASWWELPGITFSRHTQTSEQAVQPPEQSVQQPEQPSEQPPEQPSEQLVQQPEQQSEQQSEQPPEQPVQQPEQPSEQVSEQPVQQLEQLSEPHIQPQLQELADFSIDDTNPGFTDNINPRQLDLASIIPIVSLSEPPVPQSPRNLHVTSRGRITKTSQRAQQGKNMRKTKAVLALENELLREQLERLQALARR
jgi:hypothetical protein